MYSKITKIGLFFLFICCCISNTSAQTVQKIGDKPFEVAKSAVFELESKTKGFLPPRMDTGQRDLIEAPAQGLVIYNTSTNALEINTGTTVLPVWSSVKGYLPLAGGTMTGTVGVNGATLTFNTDTAVTNTNTTTIGGGLGTGTITLGGTATQAINIGTGATGTDLKTVTIGSTNAASATTINSGTGTLSLTPAETGKIVIGSTDGTGDITLGSSNVAQTTKIGAGTGTGISKVYIGTNHGGGTGGSGVYIGNTASSVSNYPSTVSIASGGSLNTVLLGGSSGASTTTIQSGSLGSINLMPYGDGKIVIGKSDGSGNITLGSSTDSQTTNIGTGTGVSTVNIATGSNTKANLVTIGGSLSQVGVGAAPVTSAALAVTSITKGFLPPRMSTSQRNLIATPTAGLVIYNTDVKALEFYTGSAWSPVGTGAFLPLAGGTMTGVIQGTALKLNDGTTPANTTDIGVGATEGTITLGGTAAQTINIGTGTTGTNIAAVNIGGTSGASTTTIQSGTAIKMTPGLAAGTILIGKTDGTGDITLGSSSVAQITNIGTGNGGSIVYITKATGDNSVVIGGDKTSATAALQVNSVTKGFLPPRVSTVQRDLIGAKVSEGLIVYNTSTRALEVNKAYANFNAEWNPVGTGIFLPLAGGTMASGSVIQGSALKLNDGTTPANTTDIGVGATEGTITLGGSANQTINIGNGAAVKTVVLGSTNTTSATTIQSGTGALNLTPATTGTVTIGNTAGTGTITVGSSSDSQITNIGLVTGTNTAKLSTVNIGTGGTGNNVVTLGSSTSQVGVAGPPVTSAALAVSSTTKGFLPPRMTTAQRNLIATPTAGLVIYNEDTDVKALEVYTGAAWSPVGTGKFLPLAGGTMTGDIKGSLLTLNSDAGTNATSIGGGSTAGPITLGGTGTQIINIGTGTGTKTVSLGSDASTSATTIKSGSAALTLTPAADIAGTIVIGNSAGLGPITLGSSSEAQTTNIGVAKSTGVSTVNIGTGGSGNNVVTLGSATSQTIVGGAATGTKAALEINSTTKGFLPPRMTTDLRAGLGTKVDQGMVIYNTSTKALEVNTADIADNAVWISVGAVSNPAINLQTADYTLKSTDSTVLFTTGGSLTATLPAVSTALTGKIFFIRKDDNSTNTLTISSPVLKLSGVTTTVVLNYAKTIKVQCDGTNWIIID